MFFLSVRISKRKIFSVAVISLVIGLLFFSFYKNCLHDNKDADTFEKRVAYLSEFNIDISNCEETVTDILLPDKNDTSFIKYNALQTCCGFDLFRYGGCLVKRYSYPLSNTNKTVSLIVLEGNVIGGDVFDTESYEYKAFCSGELNGDYTD